MDAKHLRLKKNTHKFLINSPSPHLNSPLFSQNVFVHRLKGQKLSKMLSNILQENYLIQFDFLFW